MRVALVCDWLTNVGGAEKVLLEVHRLYPKAPIYTSKYSRKGIDWFEDADVRTGWLQIFPTCMRRLLAPLRQRWFAHLDLSEYDLIISVTGAEAKGVKSGQGTCASREAFEESEGDSRVVLPCADAVLLADVRSVCGESGVWGAESGGEVFL